ncbi:MarR family winged helix-turn-helix transcriptional regulator [Pseudooceanicola onchidii]|uniref:MarR family winged helix-turn-helix transcriptional regulator n=1 Tax=Pseudooceanicola onchidii TaxID=2562279 RepID=UPI0010AB4304|nr:MarR family winged helix-turn-helix transcriptional regulator [Pseudooceanicola onchidii]
MSDPLPPMMQISDQSPPAFEELDHGILQDFVGMYLRVAYEAAYGDFKRRLGDEALKPGYFTILTLIVRNPRITQTQIGLASARDKTNVTSSLRWMEDHGLIHRHMSSRDRRTHMCVATPDGIAMQARMEEKTKAHLKALNDAIGPERLTEFIRTLRDLSAALER